MRAFEVEYYGEPLETAPPYGSEPAVLIQWLGSDTVFCDGDMSCVAVKRSLIAHDGYPEQIYVRRQPKGRTTSIDRFGR